MKLIVLMRQILLGQPGFYLHGRSLFIARVKLLKVLLGCWSSWSFTSWSRSWSWSSWSSLSEWNCAIAGVEGLIAGGNYGTGRRCNRGHSAICYSTSSSSTLCHILAIFITKAFRIYFKHSKFKHFKGSHFSPAQVIDRILFTQGPNLLIRASWCSVYTPSNVLPPRCSQCITFKPHPMYCFAFSIAYYAVTFSCNTTFKTHINMRHCVAQFTFNPWWKWVLWK